MPEGLDPSAAAAWSQGGQQEAIEALPVQQLFDPGGHIAERHGVLTSGHLLLFHPDGELLYEGGLTGARGHVGANAARHLATQAALYEVPSDQPSQAPVFGCSILSPDSETTP